MNHRDHRRHSVAHRVGDVAEGDNHEEDDGHCNEEHRNQRRTCNLSPDGRTDIAVLQGLDAAESCAQLLLDGSLGVGIDRLKSCLVFVALSADGCHGRVAEVEGNKHIAHIGRCSGVAQLELPVDAARKVNAEAERLAGGHHGIADQQQADANDDGRADVIVPAVLYNIIHRSNSQDPVLAGHGFFSAAALENQPHQHTGDEDSSEHAD